MLKMEDRLKLVNASVAFYKTSEQVRQGAIGCLGMRSMEDYFLHHTARSAVSTIEASPLGTNLSRRMICGNNTVGFLIILSVTEVDHVICFL